MDPDQLKEHLRFAAELGVAGTNPEWRGGGGGTNSK
jgi:hypothetical protein